MDYGYLYSSCGGFALDAFLALEREVLNDLAHLVYGDLLNASTLSFAYSSLRHNISMVLLSVDGDNFEIQVELMRG